MGLWFPARRHARIATHVEGSVVCAGRQRSVVVLSLSEAGFYGEGFDLEEIEAELQVRLLLDATGPGWSPWPVAGGWRSPLPGQLEVVELEAAAELLYVDPRPKAGRRRQGFGARFVALPEDQLRALRDFVRRESFRAREWRTAGGAVPVPPLASVPGRGTEN